MAIVSNSDHEALLSTDVTSLNCTEGNKTCYFRTILSGINALLLSNKYERNQKEPHNQPLLESRIEWSHLLQCPFKTQFKSMFQENKTTSKAIQWLKHWWQEHATDLPTTCTLTLEIKNIWVTNEQETSMNECAYSNISNTVKCLQYIDTHCKHLSSNKGRVLTHTRYAYE